MMTVFFADVRGFTELTDRAQNEAEEYVRKAGLTGPAAEAYFEQKSAEVLNTVNTYLATIADVIKLHRGTLDKYIGDCVMAFWGAPTANPRHAVDAVCAAIEAQKALHRLNQERESESRRREAENVQRAAAGQPLLSLLPQLSLGSGINTGYMTVGLMGSDTHILNYTVFGREVNLASRLEGVSGRGRIIIGETTYRELREFLPELAIRCVPLDPVSVKGFRHPFRSLDRIRNSELTARRIGPRVADLTRRHRLRFQKLRRRSVPESSAIPPAPTGQPHSPPPPGQSHP
jgi:class 3 adenylate cyclase